MSKLATIETDVEKFFKGTGANLEKFAAEFEKLFKKLPSALQTVENFTSEVAPVIETAVAIADPLAEPAVQEALQTAEVGLVAIQTAAADATDGQTLLTNIQNFAADIPSLLTGLKITNPALQNSVSAVANVIAKECAVLIPAVKAWVAQLTPPAPTAAA
jgi:hypothetical protein